MAHGHEPDNKAFTEELVSNANSRVMHALVLSASKTQKS